VASLSACENMYPHRTLRTIYLGIFVELVRSNEVNREDELDIVLLRLFNESMYFFRAGLVEQGVADLVSIQGKCLTGVEMRRRLLMHCSVPWRT